MQPDRSPRSGALNNPVGVYGSSRYRARVSAFLRELRWYRESYFVLSFVQGFFYGMKEM